MSPIAKSMAILGFGLCTATPVSAEANLRIQLGIAFADAILSTRPRELLEESSVTARLDGLNGGEGPGLSLSFWRDTAWLGKSVSFGAELFSSRSDPSATFTLRQGTDNVTFDLGSEATFTTLFFNLTRRYSFGKLHPYAGAGVGLGFAKLKPKSRLLDGEIDTLHAGTQALIGIDYDFRDNTYVGASLRVYYVDGRPFDVDLQYSDRVATLYLGLRF